jgi:mannobiose 2-epimerase
MKPNLLIIAFALAATQGLHAAAEPAAGAAPTGPVPSSAAISLPQTPGLPAVDLAALRSRIDAELHNDILPFWLKLTRDRERGGFYGAISNDLVINKDAPRGALLTSRILWTFSSAYRRYHDPACLEMARWAYDDLISRFWDKEQGGLFWSVSANGKPLVTRKVVYGQAFGIYALAEYHRATGDRAALEHAIELYKTVEAHSHDAANGGYFEEYTQEWKRLPNWRQRYVSPFSKSQNTLLHVMEAYANLLRVWPDPGLRTNLHDLTEVMLTRVLNPATHHLRLYLDDNWTPRSEEISFGHDIEFSWLVLEAAEVLGDRDLIARSKTVAVEVARATLAEGMDADGGMLSEAGPKGLTNTHKEWWQQAESVTGYFNAYQLSGSTQFLQASKHSWDFIDAHVIDHTHGEWYNLLARNGTVLSSDKVSLWKCPYHDGRCCMEMIERIDAVLSAPPQDKQPAAIPAH